MRFNPNFLDEIRARLPVSQVVGRKVALKKAGREYKGLSPFKVERSPSFFVNDQKGFYHCFASGEHGDIFTFVMKTEGLDFPEAVERLASEAGVAMPKRDERAADDDTDRRARLLLALEAATRFFEDALRGAAGLEARRYIERRGLKPETISAFRIGFAPAARGALRLHLQSKGFSLDEMAQSGMLIAGEDIPEPYDRFRNRVMFPILDMKERTIAFGGRALDKDAQAKYLNSPETPLFHKGHVLFNAAKARPAAHAKGRVVVVEGYMDVVALCEAGFEEAVAPLGTALTADQVKLLWRFAPEPILCFDGDGAGRKAAHRAVDTVIPHLRPGYSVSFAFLPDGLDPDDYVRQHGAPAFAAILGKSRALIDVLWERETGAGPLATPEQKAALEARVRGIAAGVAEPTVRTHYDRELRDRLYQLGRRTPAQRQAGDGRTRRSGGFTDSYASPVAPEDWRTRDRRRLDGRPARGGWSGAGRFSGPGEVSVTASAELAKLSHAAPVREALILKTLLNHPWLIDEHSEDVAELTFTSAALSALRDQILAIHAGANSLDSTTLGTQLTKTGVAKAVDLVAQTITHASDRFAEPEASAADVETAWTHILALHQRQDALYRMLKAAEDAWRQDCSEEAWVRLLDVKRQIAAQSANDQIDAASNGYGALPTKQAV